MEQQALGLLTPGIMPPDDPTFAAQLRASVPGMAHFGGTGPQERTCRECIHWGRSEKFRREGGALLPRRCLQFSRLMQQARLTEVVDGAGIPHAQPSCRHFSPREMSPGIEPRPRKAKSLPDE